MSRFGYVRMRSTDLSRRAASHLNTAVPEVLVGQIWLQEDEPPPVEIIEVKTSDEFDQSPDECWDDARNANLDHAWSYVNNDRLQQLEENFKINKRARERRRMNYEKNLRSTTTSNTNNHFINNFYSDVAGNYSEDNKLNHQVNCFTIINKHFINSDTSSEGEYPDVEIITSNDIIMDPTNWDSRNESYKEEIITYDPDSDKETRTIWIYSFKNKHLLGDDYEFTDTANRALSSGTTSSSQESDETKEKSTNVHRIGSPIPPTYIPRLNLALAPTLSTVTEVSEPNKQPSGSNKSLKNKFQKQNNNWFHTEKLDSGRSLGKHEKSTNVVNWMALSPREKRRRSKEQVGDMWEGSLLKLDADNTKKSTQSIEQQTNESEQNNALKVDVDVHVGVNEISPGKKSIVTPNSADIHGKSKTEETSPINKIKYIEVGLRECTQDRGDHDMKLQQVLCHKKRDNVIDHNISDVTPPTKLSSAEWDRETKLEKETVSYDYISNKFFVTEMDNNPDQLWMKNNMPLLKPSHWNEYLPISESAYSLHLSLSSIVEERKPWFKRIMKYIKCCK